MELDPITCMGRAVAIDFSADGTLLIIGGDMRPDSERGFVQLFDLATCRLVGFRELPHPVYKFTVTCDDRILTACSSTVRVLKIPSLEEVHAWDPFDQGGMAFCIAMDRAHGLFAVGEFHNEERPARIRIYDAVTLQPRAEIAGPKYGITSLAFSDLPGVIASGSMHLPNGVVAWHWPLEGSNYDSMLLSPEMRDLARSLIEAEGRQEHVRSGRVISTLRTQDTIGGMCFYPKSSRLLAVEGTLNRTADAIYVFDVFGNKPGDVPQLCGHTSFPIGVDIDPSGRFAATVHAKGEVYIWPAQDIQHLKDFRTVNRCERQDHIGQRSRLRFHPRARYQARM